MALSRPFYTVSFVVLILFSFSCSNNNNDQKQFGLGDAERIVVDGAKVDKEVDIADWIEEIRVFPLEETEGSMLGDVEKVLLTDDYMIVYVRMETRGIVVFDRKGRFVRKLSIVGDGPDKLTQITDCWLNNKRNIRVN